MFNSNTGKIAGQKSKRKPSIEKELIVQLDKLNPLAFEKLKKGIEENNFNYLKLYFAYRYGRPKIVQDVNLTTEQPLFDLS